MKTSLNLGVAGLGIVGGNLRKYFEKNNIPCFVYDKFKNIGSMEELNKADVVFVCVPTPYLQDGSGFDLSAVREVVSGLEGNKDIVIKSTVVPGTTEKLQNEFSEHNFYYNPEFLTEITSEYDTFYPKRQIIGCVDIYSWCEVKHPGGSKSTSEPIRVSIYSEKFNAYTARAKEILEILPHALFEKVVTSTEAEMIKYFGNTLYATRVTFANQMYDLCQRLGVDYEVVKDCARQEPMVGENHLDIFHKGYRGYGGKCLVKDTRALIQLAKENGVDMRLLVSAEEYNNKLMVDQKIKDPEKMGLIN